MPRLRSQRLLPCRCPPEAGRQRRWQKPWPTAEKQVLPLFLRRDPERIVSPCSHVDIQLTAESIDSRAPLNLSRRHHPSCVMNKQVERYIAQRLEVSLRFT